MASIRLRNGKYQVQIRIGDKGKARSFTTHAAAKSWARQEESKAEQQLSLEAKYKPQNFAEILIRYLDEVIPTKRNTEVEPNIIAAALREKWVHLPLSSLKVTHITAYRYRCLKEIKANSFHRIFGILKHACVIAEREWDWETPRNIFIRVRVDRCPAPLVQRVTQDQLKRLLKAAEISRNKFLGPLIALAVEISLRRSELLSIIWTDVAWRDGVIRVAETKSGFPRIIPMTIHAEAVLRALWAIKGVSEEHVFPLAKNAVRLGFQRIRERAGLPHICFHHLRHEAISRFFDMGLTPPEVASISGHRTLSQLMRYSHADTTNVLQKLRSPSLLLTE